MCVSRDWHLFERKSTYYDCFFRYIGTYRYTPGELDKKTLDKKRGSHSGSIEVKKTSRNETLACGGEQAKF